MAIHYTQGYTANPEGGANLASFQGNLEDLIRCLANRQRAVTGKSTTVADPDATLATLAKARGAFGATGSATQTAIAHATRTKVVFDSELWDADALFNPTLSRFTAAQAGRYLLGGAVLLATTVDAKRGLLYLHKNGLEHRSLSVLQTSQASNVLLCGAAEIVAAANDYYEIFVEHDFGVNTPSISSGEVYRYFWGYYLGS